MENKQATLELGTKPVGKLLIQYALPAMIAMTAASLYNIVDRVFIGQGVGAMAISGLAITFPFMNLTAAFGAGVGVGASTAISVKLGQKDYATAQNILGNTISLNLIIGIGLSIICLLFLLFNLRERQRVKLFCLGSASLVLLLHIAALRLSFQFTNLTFDTVATGPAPGLLGALGSRTWLYPLFLYLLLLPLACVPPRQDSSPDNSSFRKEVDA